MTERMSLGDFRALQARSPKVGKYNNRRTLVDGWYFDSKGEAARYIELKQLRQAGEVKWFICQVPFRLPGKIVYLADFLVVWRWGLEERGRWGVEQHVTVEDYKGVMTRSALNKIKQVEEIYGIKVNIITRSAK
jgi:hypothetical protein